MERAIIAIVMCLSAACLVSCQTPSCPEDVQSNPRNYYSYSYSNRNSIKGVRCTYLARLGYAGIYYGTRRVSKVYYVCREGLTKVQVNAQPPIFLCDEDPIVGSGDIDEPIKPIVEEATDAPSMTTQRPPVTTQRPTTATEAPTNSAGLSQCPRDNSAYGRNDYTYSSLNKIVQQKCFIRVRIQGASSTRTTTIWQCVEGYKRQRARRGQFKCVRA